LLLEKLQEERESRERFVATLTHDLRTPLTAAKISENMYRADNMIWDFLDANLLSAG
jgi:signal transduction histidine kinase